MKSGLAAMVAAVIALNQSALLLKGDLLLALSGAQMTSMLGAKEFVRRGDLDGAGAVLVGEPTSMQLVIAHKGSAWMRAHTNGSPGHGAFRLTANERADNAILQMCTFLARASEIRLEHVVDPLLGSPTLNVGTIRGGSSAVLAAERCEADLDVRLVPGMTAQEVASHLSAIAGPGVALEVLDEKQPIATSPDHPFVAIGANALAAHTGTRSAPLGLPIYSDAAVICPALNIPMVMIGPGEIGMSGAGDESVQIGNVIGAAGVYYDIARRWLT